MAHCNKLKVMVLCLVPLFGWAQQYHGTTGLLHVPSAEMDSAGTFRGGASYLDKRFLPSMPYYGDGIPFNSMAYTIGVTAFSWLELSYTGTLVKIHKNYILSEPLDYYNEDRHINIKLQPLKEGKWWPAVAVGWDDIGNLKTLKVGKKLTTNNYFENLYGVVSKNLELGEHRIGVHMAYRYYPSDKNKERRGLAGGITYSPSFYRPLRGIVEWDGVGVNVGVDVLLWRHLFVQAALVHGKGFMGGMSYHYTIDF